MRVEFDTNDDSIIVDGIRVSLSFLRQLCDPNPNIFMRFYVNDKSEICLDSYPMKTLEELVR